MRTVALHKTDIKLNKDKLKDILDSRDLSYIQFHEKLVDAYGLDLTYKGFMSLLTNRNSWKLLYAFAIVDTLKVDIRDVFDVVDVDIEKKMKEKEAWKNKYQKKKK